MLDHLAWNGLLVMSWCEVIPVPSLQVTGGFRVQERGRDAKELAQKICGRFEAFWKSRASIDFGWCFDLAHHHLPQKYNIR